MRELDHGRKAGYLAAMKQIGLNAKLDTLRDKEHAKLEQIMRAEQTDHRLLALFLTASKLWR